MFYYAGFCVRMTAIRKLPEWKPRDGEDVATVCQAYGTASCRGLDKATTLAECGPQRGDGTTSKSSGASKGPNSRRKRVPLIKKVRVFCYGRMEGGGMGVQGRKAC